MFTEGEVGALVGWVVGPAVGLLVLTVVVGEGVRTTNPELSDTTGGTVRDKVVSPIGCSAFIEATIISATA